MARENPCLHCRRELPAGQDEGAGHRVGHMLTGHRDHICKAEAWSEQDGGWGLQGRSGSDPPRKEPAKKRYIKVPSQSAAFLSICVLLYIA